MKNKSECKTCKGTGEFQGKYCLDCGGQIDKEKKIKEADEHFKAAREFGDY
jgi:predicted amidophosphoribosyltransferase